ncbi:MAG TPA: 50S ribosomal protein L29 [Alphaproteobacteria bacterium]|nr:50S ribosomal protein L29 [Alphaproteobacteria bacterium]
MSGKITKVADLRAKTDDQLSDNVLQLRREQLNLRFQQASGQLQNTARVRAVRRELAKTKTVQQQRRSAADKK